MHCRDLDIEVRTKAFQSQQILNLVNSCYAPDLNREGHYKMKADVCLSVRLSVACLDLTRELKSLKPKIGVMEASHTSKPRTYLEVKRSKVKVTRPINTVTMCHRREFP